MRPAEEVAREMVHAPRDDGDGVWRIRVEGSDDWVTIEPHVTSLGAEVLGIHLRGIITRLIEESRADGAETERAIRCAVLEAIEERLDSIVKRTRMYGGLEAIEFQVLLLLEQRSALGRPSQVAQAPDEVRDLWTTLVVERGGRWATAYLFCSYDGKPFDEYAVALGELIALVRERLPLDVGTPAPVVTVPDCALLEEVQRRWPELAAVRFEREEPRRSIEVSPEEDGRWKRAFGKPAPFPEAVLEAVARVRR